MLSYTLDSVFAERSSSDVARKTKIICTLGPACWSVENLIKLIDAGMNVCRFNFSHGEHAGHQACLDRVHEAMRQRPDHKIALLLDTKGPEIRTGLFRDGLKSIELQKGAELKIVTDYEFKGDSTCIACSYAKLPSSVSVGSRILMADGSVSLEVTSVGTDFVMTRVLNNAKIGERKNMNLPGVKVDLPVCGPREIEDIKKFLIPNKMHGIAVSFVQCAEDIREVRRHLCEADPKLGPLVQIIPKIENQEGLNNIDEIIEVADGLMVARGDLGMEIPLEKVFIAQKYMIQKCNAAGKFVITATQMLESMINAPRPTRAEVGDIANAVLDGSDSVMLSGETANGAFFEEALRYMARTSKEAEYAINYRALQEGLSALNTDKSVAALTACGAVRLAEDSRASAIIVLSQTGNTAKLLAKFRPSQPIVMPSQCEILLSSMSFVRGVIPLSIDSFIGTDVIVRGAIDAAIARGIVARNDKVVVVHGTIENTPFNSNTIKLLIA